MKLLESGWLFGFIAHGIYKGWKSYSHFRHRVGARYF